MTEEVVRLDRKICGFRPRLRGTNLKPKPSLVRNTSTHGYGFRPRLRGTNLKPFSKMVAKQRLYIGSFRPRLRGTNLKLYYEKCRYQRN